MQTYMSLALLNNATAIQTCNVAFFFIHKRSTSKNVQMIYGKHRLRVHTNAANWAEPKPTVSFSYSIKNAKRRGGDAIEG